MYIGLKRLPLSAFDPLLEQIRCKLSAWKARAFSFAGKVTLIHSILQAIPVYIMSSGGVPKALLKKIDCYCRRFLWSNDGERRGLVLVAWKHLCWSNADGGLGFKNLKAFHEA